MNLDQTGHAMQPALQQLRPLGSLERVSTTRSRYGIYNNVGVTVTYELSSDVTNMHLKSSLFNALALLIEKHPNLSAVPIDKGQSTQAYFVRPATIDLERCITFIEGRIASDENHRDLELDELIEKQHRLPFATDQEPPTPFWRLIVVSDPRYPLKFIGCFIFHHTILDGMSGMLFHEHLVRALSAGSSTSPPLSIMQTPKTQLAPNVEALRDEPIPSKPPYVKDNADSQDVEDHIWSGESPQLPQTIRFESIHVPKLASRKFIAACKANQTTVTGALHALIASVIFDILPLRFTKMYCGATVAFKRWLMPPLEDTTLGNWTGGFEIIFERDASFSWSEARRCRQSYVDHLSDRGRRLQSGCPAWIEKFDDFFLDKIGKKRRHGFEISNVGVLRSPLGDGGSTLPWKYGRVLFSQCASATAGIKVSVSSGADERLNLGFSYSEGAFDEVMKNGLVEKVYDKIVAVSEERSS